MKANDFPSTPHLAFMISDIKNNYIDLLSNEEKFDLEVARQAGRDYTVNHFLRVSYLLDSCSKIRKTEELLRKHYRGER